MGNLFNPQQVLLLALTSGDGYALELIDRVAEKTNGQIVLGQGSVYPALRALKKEGLVKTFQSEPLQERGGRRRTYYSLTAEGERVARESLLAVQALIPVGGCYA